MRPPQYTITPKDVDRHAAHLCQTHLKLKDHGPKCRAGILLKLLFYAAARISSIAATCKALKDVPSDQAVYDALTATLPELHELQRRVNRALAGDIPRAFRRHKQPLAIDFTLVAYHGQHFQDEDEVYRGQPKNGTSHFHAYATSYVIRKGCRFTLALTSVRKGEKLEAVVKRLLQQTARVGVKPRYLLLDKGFYSVGVIRYLQAARYRFLMPVVCRGRKRTDPRGPSGTRVYQIWKTSGWSRYTLRDAKGRTATLSICVKCRNYRGQWKRHGRQKLVYGFWGLSPSSPEWVRATYRTRFGIESSYRQLHQARIRTSTRNPLVRFLYVAVALILRNVWVWVHWEVLAERIRGGRTIDLNRLPFRAMLLGLQHLAEELLGISDTTCTEYPLLS